MSKDHHNIHTAVLVTEVLKYVAPQKGETYLDATAGYGGHANTILLRTLQDKGSVLIDRDKDAVNELKDRFIGRDLKIIHDDFLSASKKLQKQKSSFDIILADLGVSSPHLDNASRGFSFTNPGPLDMRMDQQQNLSAYEVVNNYSENELITILRKYGQEPKARKIAHAIVVNRPIESTEALALIVAKAKGGGYKKTHPATKTFQAIRITVNDEIQLLKEALPIWHDLLNPGGRLAIISFHSLEDKMVKNYLTEHAGSRYDATLQLVTKKPVSASQDELVFNPRARSAKLRVAAKIKTTKGAQYAYSGKK